MVGLFLFKMQNYLYCQYRIGKIFDFDTHSRARPKADPRSPRVCVRRRATYLYCRALFVKYKNKEPRFWAWLFIEFKRRLQALFNCLAFSFVAGLIEQRKHILLVGLDTGLVEGIYPQNVAADTARALEEVE